MKVLLQLAFLFALCLIGEMISGVLPFLFPGNIIAMVLLFALLAFRIIKAEALHQTSSLLLSIIGLVFMPPVVGVLDIIPLLRKILVPLLVISIVSAILTFWASSATAALVSKVLERIRSKRGDNRD